MPNRNREPVRMRRTTNLHLDDIPTAAGGISRAAYALASQAQISLGPLLKRSNLSVEQAKNPGLRIAVKDQIKFLNLVAEELQDEFLGIRLAQATDLRELGLLYYVMASSNTIGEALRRVSRYSTIQNESVKITYRGGKTVTVAFDYFGVARRFRLRDRRDRVSGRAGANPLRQCRSAFERAAGALLRRGVGETPQDLNDVAT